MSEEKSSPIGIIVVVAVIAVVAAFFVGKSGGSNGDQTAGKQEQPTNGSDTNKTTPPPEPPKPEKPAEPKEPAFVKEGLVAYYPFNGNAEDESGNGFHITKMPAWSEDRNGHLKSAAMSDGNFPLSSPDVTLGADGYSAVFWVKFTKFEIVPNYDEPRMLLHGSWDSRKRGMWSIAVFPGGRIALAIMDKNNRQKTLWGESSLGDGNWHCLAFSCGKKEAVMYLNGSFNAKIPIELTELTAPILIGGDLRSHKMKSNQAGSIDDVRIYNRALSAEEVKALYEFEKPKEKGEK